MSDDKELFGLDEDEGVDSGPKKIEFVNPEAPGPLDTDPGEGSSDPFAEMSFDGPSVDARPTQVDIPALEQETSEGWVDPNPTQVDIPVLEERVFQIKGDLNHLSPGSALLGDLACFRGEAGNYVLNSMYRRIRERNDGGDSAYHSSSYVADFSGERSREEVIDSLEDFIIGPLCLADTEIQLRKSDGRLERDIAEIVIAQQDVDDDRTVDRAYVTHKKTCLQGVDESDAYGKIVYGLFDELFKTEEEHRIKRRLREARLSEVKTFEGAMRYVKGETEDEKLINIERYAKHNAKTLFGKGLGRIIGNPNDVFVEGTPKYVTKIMKYSILSPMVELEKACSIMRKGKREKRLTETIERLEKGSEYFDVIAGVAQGLGIFEIEEDEKVKDARIAYSGDVHGAYDRFVELLSQINTERYVFLGDYIDRGEDSVRVIDHVLGMVESGEAIAQLGNHDLMFMGAMEGSGSLMFQWLYNGGYKVLEQVNEVDEKIDNAIAATREYRDDPEDDDNYNELKRCIDELASYEVLWNHPKLNKMYHGLRRIGQSGGGSKNIDRVFSVHGGVPVDKEGRMIFKYRGLTGREAFESMQGDFVEGVFVDKMSDHIEGLNEGLGDESLPCDDYSPFFASDRNRTWEWYDRVNTPEKADELLRELDADVIVYAHSAIKPNDDERETDYGKRCRVHHDGRIIGIDFGMAGTYGGRGGALLIHDNGDASFVGFESGSSDEVKVLYSQKGLVKEPVQRDVEEDIDPISRAIWEQDARDMFDEEQVVDGEAGEEGDLDPISRAIWEQDQKDIFDEPAPTLAPEDALETPENLAHQLCQVLGFTEEREGGDTYSLLSTLSAFRGDTADEILESLDRRVDDYGNFDYQHTGCYLLSDDSRIKRLEATVVGPLANLKGYDPTKDEGLIAAVRVRVEEGNEVDEGFRNKLTYMIDDNADNLIGPNNEYNLIVRRIFNYKVGQINLKSVIDDIERSVRAGEYLKVDPDAPEDKPSESGARKYMRRVRGAVSSAKDTVLGGLTGWGKEVYRRRKDLGEQSVDEVAEPVPTTELPEDRYEPEVFPADEPMGPNLADVLTQGSPVREAIDEVLGRGEQIPQGEVIEGDYQVVEPEPVAEPGRVKDAIPIDPVPKRAAPRKKPLYEPPVEPEPVREQSVPRQQTEVYVLETFGSISEGYTDRRDIAMACFRTGRFIEGYEMLEGVSPAEQLNESKRLTTAGEKMREGGYNHIANYYENLGKIFDPYSSRDERRNAAENVSVSMDAVMNEELSVCLGNMGLISVGSKEDARAFYNGARAVFGSERADEARLNVLRQTAERLDLHTN